MSSLSVYTFLKRDRGAFEIYAMVVIMLDSGAANKS
jgi:hypothetical protein